MGMAVTDITKLKQKRLVKAYLETGNVSEAGRIAGYSDRQAAHKALTTSNYIQTEVQSALALAGLDPSIYAEVIASLLTEDDWKARAKAIELLVKLQGTAAPTKHITAKLSYAEQARTALNSDKAQSITAQQSQATTEGEGVRLAMLPTVTLAV